MRQLLQKLQANQVHADQQRVSQQDQMSAQGHQILSQQEQLTTATAERQALQRALEDAKNAAVNARQVCGSTSTTLH